MTNPIPDNKTPLSSQQVAEIFALAARHHQQHTQADYCLDDVLQAAEEAGIPQQVMQEALRTVMTREPEKQVKPRKPIGTVFKSALAFFKQRLIQGVLRGRRHIVGGLMVGLLGCLLFLKFIFDPDLLKAFIMVSPSLVLVLIGVVFNTELLTTLAVLLTPIEMIIAYLLMREGLF